MNIRRVRTSRGWRSVLTYWYRGVRYRPVLGLNLTGDQEREAALEIVAAIHSNTAQHPLPSSSGAVGQVWTFADLIPAYLQYLHAKRRDADSRNDAALRLHLLPFFGTKLLRDIRLQDGLTYLEHRRAEQAADGTIERECSVLMAVLNLAVDLELLDRNRLRRLPVPAGSQRTRIVEPSDLLRLRHVASEPIWRAILAGLQTGLRVNKLVETHAEWIVQKGDGFWLFPSPGRSAIKGVPKALPLNGLAVEALYGGQARVAGRFFERWKDAGSFKHRWIETVQRAGLTDLVFHDIRRTFATWLTQSGVDYAVIRMLRGEPLPGSAKYYIQNWDVPLREAVTRLEQYTRRVLEGETATQIPVTATTVPPSYLEQTVTMRNVVPRDRIELSTPAFSGLCSAN